MTTPGTNSSAQSPLPSSIADFIVALMRAVNTARLYASGHDLFKKHTQQLYTKLHEAIADRDFLFLGCARDTFFLEGTFYHTKDVQLEKFLKFFHSLRISYIFLDKEITAEELESFIGLLAGAQQGQGDEVFSALSRENITRVRLGLLDYTIFSTVQTVASQLTQRSEDEAIWRQLILQPAGAGAFNLSPEQTKQLTSLCEDVEELKKLLLEMDSDMAEKQQGASVTQRGVLLGNFIQNLGDILSGIAPVKRELFARQVGGVLDSLELDLKVQILGAVAPDAIREEESDVIHDIFQAMPDSQLVCLLGDSLKEAGAKSACFNNLFNRALAKYKEPGLLLTLIQREMHGDTQEGGSDNLSHWQHLEQLLVQHQETEEFNEQYHKEIEALASSLNMKVPMVEEEEMGRLLKTLTPESLRPARAQLILDLISQRHTPEAEAFLPSLLEGIGEILSHFLSQENFLTVGNLLREVFLALSDFPEEASVRKTINSLLSAEDIRALLRNLLKRCRTYEAKETVAISAVRHLFPQKAGGFLLDVLVELEDEDSAQARWLRATLTSLGPSLGKILNRGLPGAPDHALPQLLSLASISADRNLGTAVGQLLDHQDHEIRVKVVSTLGALKAEGAVPRLGEIVLQKSWLKSKKMRSLQMAAARALAEIGTNKAQEVLHEVVNKGSGDLQALCQELVLEGD
jgi:HEAT repeat protein